MADDSFEHEYDNWDIATRTDIIDNFRRMDFALVGSLNFHLQGDPGVQIRLNYAHGLANIYDPSIERISSNRTFQLGIMIPIKAGIGKKEK